MKKPDAITVLSENNYKKKIYDLPANTLLFVGKSAYETLKRRGIYTIGDLALSRREEIEKYLGKLGGTIHDYALGKDDSIVKKYTDEYNPKSVSKGITFAEDTRDMIFLENTIKKLASNIAKNLRKYDMKAEVVSIIIKDNKFNKVSRQMKVEKTDLFQKISFPAIKLLKEMYFGDYDIRMITVGVSNLVKNDEIIQCSFFTEKDNDIEKLERVTKTLDDLNEKFGNEIVFFNNIKN